ncbi:hypothetical protein AAG570_010706 [Ranatra chinensis]|uniref:Hemimethylated DNA-binding domain-containing protein n=1 Tax=Ranatra chinensis TaxID=642074 RepID=A0ABD0YQH3_9HEMI
MGVSCRNIYELSFRQFSPFVRVSKRHQRAIDYIIDELMAIVNDKNKQCNLTRKYYGLKVLCYLQQLRLCKVWDEIVNLPENKQILEDGAFFIGQWQYPEVDVIRSEIRKSLDGLAREVLVLLREQTGGKHPVLNVGSETFREWGNTILTDNQWRPEQCDQIIEATSNLLFGKMGFKVQRCIYQNLPINKQLHPEQRKIVMCYFNSKKPRAKDQDNISDDLHAAQIIPKRRGISNVKYAVGLIMQHKQYGYRCVVLGWDPECVAPSEWMETMRLHLLEFKQYQPFYNVLVEDGSLRYAAQENLYLVDEDYEIDRPEVGRYFIKWCGRYYEPTPIKATEYPDDKNHREALLSGKIVLH